MSQARSLYDLILAEIRQLESEGCEVEPFREQARQARQDPEALQALYHSLLQATPAADFQFTEPEDLSEILSEAPGPLHIPFPQRGETGWKDRFYGAWLGCCVGSALGLPFETPAFRVGLNGARGWENILSWYTGAGEVEIHGYVPGFSTAHLEHALTLAPTAPAREDLAFTPYSEELLFTWLGLRLVENRGYDFDAWDAGKHWQVAFPVGPQDPACAQALANLEIIHPVGQIARPEDWRAQLNWIRRYHNPARESSGALMRANGLAFSAAGLPEIAARLAWQDGYFSHAKSGLYAEMYLAAAIAAAFTARSAGEVIEAGLSVTPANSRLGYQLTVACDLALDATSTTDLAEALWDEFHPSDHAAADFNAVAITAAVLFSNGDFESGLVAALLIGGQPTRNCSSVGAILGALNGSLALPAPWIEPLHDFIKLSPNHPQQMRISECARRSYENWLALQA